MNFSDATFIGGFTMVAGISALIQIILLALMFTVSRNPFGTISDYFYVLTPLLILPLFLAIRKFQGVQNTVISQVVQIIGIIGILLASLAQVVLLLKIIDFKQSIWGNTIGLGLIGIPILVFSLMNFNNSTLPASFNWFGATLGIVMAVGIPAVFFFINAVFCAWSKWQFGLVFSKSYAVPRCSGRYSHSDRLTSLVDLGCQVNSGGKFEIIRVRDKTINI